MMIRKTYVTINENILEDNVRKITKKYPNYKYYFGVVKNNCYHHGIKSVNSLINGGVNYLAVSSLEEAIKIRKYQNNIPILCLEVIPKEFLYDAINYNVTLSVDNLDYLKSILEEDIKYDVKIHLVVDSGMNRLGFKEKSELEDAYNLLQNKKHFVLEGIYSHFATSGVLDKHFDEQLECFKELTKNIDLKKIPIVHLGRSATLVQHDKIDFCNGIRLGIIMFGFNLSMNKDNSFKGKLRSIKNNYLKKKLNISRTKTYNDLDLKTAMTFNTVIMSKRKVLKSEFVGYGANYKVKDDGYIYTLPVGYADGVTKEYKYVYIGEDRLDIVSDCMDMIMVYSAKEYDIGTNIEIFGNNRSIKSVSNSLKINVYHLFNMISNRVVYVYLKDKDKEEINY